MKQTIELKKDSAGEYVMQFSNCSIDFPKTTGLHVVSPACGSGKTTIISEVIKEKWSSGILVVTATIEAAEELAEKMENSLKTTFISYKACVLHSGSNRITEMELYKNDPTCLKEYDVLIITSARLIIDPGVLFLTYKDTMRGYTMIDEMINFYPPAFEVPREFIDVVTYVDQSKTGNGKKGIEFESDGKTWYQHLYKDKATMTAAYTKSKYKLFKAKNGLTRYKTDYIMSHLLGNGITPILGKVKDFSGQTCILLFDGTSDSMFKDTDSRLLPISGSRYSSDVCFTTFEQRLKRKNSEGWCKDDILRDGSNFIGIVKKSCDKGKTLIVTWKTIDVFKGKKNDSTPDTYEGEDKNQYDFPKLLTECLTDFGVSDDQFSVIYRGSGRDRGSNEFRDYATIMFLGEWRIPDNIVGDINSMFDCTSSFKDYMRSLMIQTICRIQIRDHTGLPIDVYFSDDIDYNLMYEVQDYFKRNSLPSCSITGIKSPCKKLSKPEKGHLLDMITLYSYDSMVRDSIRDNKHYSFTITLTELYNLIPKKKKAKDRYSNLVKYLNKRNIILTIN